MFKLSVSGPNSNFPVSSNDVSTYSPTQGSTYPMAGITALRPNPQTRSTFWDTDATGIRRNLNIGQEQSPMKTPDMPQLPKEGSYFKLGYAHALEKLALSNRLLNQVVANKHYSTIFGGIADAVLNGKPVKPGYVLRDEFRKARRVMARIHPELRKIVTEPPWRQITHPLVSAKDAWKVDPTGLPTFLRKHASRAKNFTPATGSMTSPGKEPGGAVPIQEKPVTRGGWDHAIWR